MNHELLEMFAPAALATKASEKVSDKLTKDGKPHYTFLPTYRIVDDLHTMGWNLIDGSQQRSHKSDPNAVKHMLRFRHDDYRPSVVGDTIPEIVIVNSHDCSSAFKFYLGLFRLVCQNGMIVKSSDLMDLRVPHRFYTFEIVSEMVTAIVKKAPSTLNKIEQFKQKNLTQEDRLLLAKYSLAARFSEYQIMDENGIWTGNINADQLQKEINLEKFMEPIRKEDEGKTLWNTFNLVQEKVMKGGFVRHSEKNEIYSQKRAEAGKIIRQEGRTVRPLTNIGKTIQVNQDMWSFAEAMA